MAEELDYEELFREYAPRVREVARRRLPGHHASEDVVQEVFLRAFRAAGTIDADRPIWPFLRRITLNVCTDVLRAPRTWAEEPVGELPDTSGVEVDPAAGVLASEQRRLILDALGTLPARQKEALLRRVIDGVSSEDMAAEEGSTVEAVKSAVKRSRHGFRAAYRQLGEDRGLLGIPAASREAIGSAVARVRIWANDVARTIAEHPAFQSLPAAVSAAVLLFGFSGAGPLSGAGAELAEPPSNSLLFASVGSAAGHGGLQSPPQTARPGGGGMPPSPPPGNSNKQDEPRAPLTRVVIGPTFEEDPGRGHSRFRLRVEDETLGTDGETFVGADVNCWKKTWRVACDVFQEASETAPLVVGWG